MRFLIIEDNSKLAEIIKRVLEEQTYTADVRHTGFEGEELAASGKYDGIILDIMLPDHDGMQICRNLRRRKVHTPVLMLTSLAATENKVDGLDAGADDYLTKPFETDELLARVRALLRRAQASEGTALSYDDLNMDLSRRAVSRSGTPIKLTSKEFALLEYFLRNTERVVTRTVLGEHVWDLEFEEDSNVIEVYVSRLRSKIDKPFERPLIHTVIGSGYILSSAGPPA